MHLFGGLTDVEKTRDFRALLIPRVRHLDSGASEGILCCYGLEVDTEMLACELKTSNTRRLLYAVFYRPPDVGEPFLDEFRKFLINTSSTEIDNLIITCVDWCTCSPTTADNLTETVCKMLDDHFSHPNKPSYHSSISH